MSTLLGRWQTWAGFGVAAVVLFGVAPAVLSDFRLSLLGKFLCYAIVAVGIGLAWGRGGMLVLGQGVFFGLGGYAMAMHLKLADAGAGQLPDFMQLYGQVDRLPWWWAPLRSTNRGLPDCSRCSKIRRRSRRTWHSRNSPCLPPTASSSSRASR